MTGKIAVAGCKHTTRDLILGLLDAGFAIHHVITISPEKGTSQKVAGYYDLRPFLKERNIEATVARKYSLNSREDREAITSLDIDLLLVMGWQRLIPDWFLNHLSVGAFGMHGSSKPLPHGRGRSPMNWSLIQNKTLFYTHLFQYLPGVDNGPVVGVQPFDITPWDNAHTMHLKNLTAMLHLCREHLEPLLNGTAQKQAQPEEGASYYSKRTAEDGLIYWEDGVTQIFNLIRAVTHPFPGAFTYLNDQPHRKLLIWKAIPFDTQLSWPQATPGRILNVFYDGSFLVQTGDHALLVLEYVGETLTEAHTGLFLGHLGQPRKVWENLPE